MGKKTESKDIYIAVTGTTGAGKSEFIRLCTGQDVVVGDDLQSQTSEVEDWTFYWNRRTRVHLIDTPGFDDTNRKDVEVLRDIASWLVVTARQDILLSGLVYLHPISDNRFRGSALRNLFMFKQLCGSSCLPSIVLATTMWDIVPIEDGERREAQLRSTKGFWGEMEKGGSRVMRHKRTEESAMAILDAIISHKHPQMLKIQREMVHERRSLDHTSAGLKVHEDLIEAGWKHETELAALQEDMNKADEESQQVIATLMDEQQQEMAENEKARERLKTDIESLEADLVREMETWHAKLKEQISQCLRKEATMRALQQRWEEWDRQSVVDLEQKEDLRKQLDDLRDQQGEDRQRLKDDCEKASRRNPGSNRFQVIIQFFSRLFGF
ncbi:P-loop containing nucleoside triphosphate hydrolase [Lecanosticta acicola]|uniref:P-loop containing nucleoside triphosphate hydrolase n=1 Tax=Lecanosticta acicola TaxID=111012 RepID=A0AAI9EFS4_9PEZI|nr:P-loop containing nucleoside triphosphate hydrolase [Lecanosticta acicola]